MKRPLKIWTVVVGEPSPVDGTDVRRLRTGLLTRYLRARGHDVTWFNGTVDHAAKTQRFDHNTIQTDADGTTLIFLHGRLYTGNVSVDRIKNHRDGAKSFADIAPKLPVPDVIACSYPTVELAAAVADFAKANNIPFILDLRDMWPDVIADIAPAPLRPFAKLAMFGWYRAARYAMRAATGLVGMSGPFLDWGLRRAGRARMAHDRIFHLASDPEAVSPEALASANNWWNEAGVTADKIILPFTGTISTRHDFETIIEGARKLPEALREKIRIVFCGKGEAEIALKDAAKDLPHVVFAGWRNLAEIQALLGRATAGLLPYRNTRDFIIAYPNKVGEYMGAGLPIVTCLQGEVGQLIAAEGCGITYGEGDAASFAQILEGIATGRIDVKPMAEQARETYRRHFDSKKIFNDYADYLESLAA